MYGTVGGEIRISSGSGYVRTVLESGLESLCFYFDPSVFRIIRAKLGKTCLVVECLYGFLRESAEPGEEIGDKVPEAEAVREGMLEQQREDRSPICT